MTDSIDIVVRYSSGAYSCRVGKHSGSSTSDARTAAERLAGKLFGTKVLSMVEIGELPARPGVSRWRVCFGND